MKTLKEIKKLQKPSSGWFKINYDIGSMIVYKLQKYNFSPHWITFLRVILFMIAGILIIKKQYFFGGVFVSLSYLTDMVDGQWARLKNRSTKAGGLFDGITDKMLWLVIVLSILCSNFSKANSLMVIGILSLQLISIYSIDLCKTFFSSQKGLFKNEVMKEKGIKRFIRGVIVRKFFDWGTFFLIVTLLLMLNIVKWFFIYELVRQILVLIGVLLVMTRLINKWGSEGLEC